MFTGHGFTLWARNALEALDAERQIAAGNVRSWWVYAGLRVCRQQAPSFLEMTLADMVLADARTVK